MAHSIPRDHMPSGRVGWHLHRKRAVLQWSPRYARVQRLFISSMDRMGSENAKWVVGGEAASTVATTSSAAPTSKASASFRMLE